MSKQIIKINSDGTLKRVHTEVSGLSSSDYEYTKTEKRSKVTSNNWPRFLIISSTEDGAFTKLSPLAIQKAIVGLAGEPKSVKKIKIGLLVECTSEKHSSCLLKSKMFCNIPVTVTPHSCLNFSNELSDAGTWKESVRKKYVKIYPHRMLQQSNG